MSGEREGVAAAEELAEAAKALESGKVLRLLEEKRHLLEERLGQQELLECEAVARLLEDQVELALEVAQRMEGQAATVLRSYCLYQMRKTEEASKEMEGCQAKMDSETRQRMADHLRAQIAFRMGRGDEAARAYKEMIENSQGSVEELVVNAMAALVVDGRPQEALELANKFDMVDESLELRFNCACALADLGRVEEALKELDHVIQDCSQSSSDEGKSLEDAQRELQDILTMRAYVLQRMGKKDEALALYTKVLQSSTASKDSAFIAVAANNIVSMRRADEKLFDSQKKLSRATRISCDILTNSQRHSILANQALLSFYAKQNQQCLGLIHKLLDVFPANEFSHLLLSILAFQDTSNEKAMEEFGNLDSLTVKLAKAYFIILRGDLKAGANALRDIKEICYRPGILSTVISLYDRLNDIPSALDLFSSAIDHYSPFPDQVGMVLNLLSKAALFKASKGLHNECLNDLKQALSLRSLNSSADISQETLINFVVSASYTDSSLAAQFAADLPPLADVEFVDFMSLENSLTFPLDFIRKRKLKKDDFAISTEPNQEIKKNEDLEGTISEKQNKKKKKKAVRYPKGYDPTNPGPPPDPERWLPRWQRSTSKKGASRRKRDQQIVRGPQGASIGLSKPQSAASQVPGEELNSAPALAKGTQVKRGNKKKKPGNKGW